jgi:S-formylglutathione hydrolase FrmB
MRRGRVVIESFESDVLRGNACGDPNVRRIPIYLPPSYDEQPARRYPVVYVLTGFTGRGRMLLNDNPWSPSLDDRMDALIEGGPGLERCGEMILVMPDCFTRYGGSQYINSTATGRYEDHLIGELVPHIDRNYRTLAAREHRGVAGKSSGGYGAMVLSMRHAEVFGAAVSHSGDMYFDYCYRGDIPRDASRVIEAGGARSWFEGFERKVQKPRADFDTLNILAMAAAYSPNPRAELGIDLPFDPVTGAFREDVWQRWRSQDPIEMLERHADALRSLRLLFFDCGTRDEFHLHLGARLFAGRLRERGIAHVHQEFDDGHMNVSYRYDVSLPLLSRALAG